MPDNEIPQHGILRYIRLRHRLAHVGVSIAVLFMSSLALLGYVFHKVGWYQWTDTPMAVNTATCFFLIGLLELYESFAMDT